MTDSGLDSHSSEALTIGGVIGEQQGESRADARLAGDLGTIFNAMDRIITMMRVYPRGHPILDELAENLSARFQRVFEEHTDSVFVRVGAQGLSTFADTEFFSKESSDKGQYLWYNPYADGLLLIEFHAGLTAQELLDFLAVIDIAAQGAITSDDDTVTLLWERELQHIEYTAVEGFVDSGGVETFENLSEPDAIALVADSLESPNGDAADRLQRMFNNLNMQHLDLFTRMEIQAQAKMVVTELRDADLAYAFGVEEKLLVNLNREWTSGVDLEYRLIEALLSIVRTAPGSEAGKRAADMISAVARQLIDEKMFAQATRVLELLHDRRELFVGAEYDPLGELIEELSDPLQLEALLYTMQKSTKQRGAIGALLMLLGPAKVQLQILRLVADEKRKIVAMKQLFDVLFQATTDENQHQVLAKELMESDVYLRRMLTELPEYNATEFAPTPRLIRAGLNSSDADTQAVALAIDHPVWSDATLAEKYLVPLSNSGEEDLRKRALERLGEFHPDLFRNAIRDNVLAADLKGRTHAELRFLMRVYLDSDPSATAFLHGLLTTRGWMGKSKREFAKMAAAVLIERGDVEALKIVQKSAESFWTSPDLKRSFSATIERYATTELLESSETMVESDD